MQVLMNLLIIIGGLFGLFIFVLGFIYFTILMEYGRKRVTDKLSELSE